MFTNLKTDWRNLSDVRFIKGFMGFYESPQEILAGSRDYNVAPVRCFDRIIAGFSSGTIYLYVVLGAGHWIAGLTNVLVIHV